MGPRDGLQNEKSSISVEQKIALIEYLEHAGLKTIEAGSFVSPKWVPQMADTDKIFRHLNRREMPHDTQFSALTPNITGS